MQLLRNLEKKSATCAIFRPTLVYGGGIIASVDANSWRNRQDRYRLSPQSARMRQGSMSVT